MNLLLLRNERAAKYTTGYLYWENSYVCDTLEPHCIDWEFEQKTLGETAIPEGTYRVQLRWSNHFRTTLPMVCDVPHFEGVLIHPGNTTSDTRGCILVGEETVQIEPDNVCLRNSRKALRQLMSLLRSADNITLTIQ